MIANQRTDPTQTLTLRRRFAAVMRGRFNRLNSRARAYLNDNKTALVSGELFTDAFMSWLERKEEQIIFENESDKGRLKWMIPLVTGAVLAGARYADKTVLGVPQFSNIVLPDLNPLNFKSEIDFILERNFRLLKGVTEVMNLQIKAELIRGMREGLGPREVGDLITGRIKSIGATRGELIARTETIRAHAETTLTRFQMYGIREVRGQVELRTARDARVCPICAALDTNIYTIEEARGVIPVHPR